MKNNYNAILGMVLSFMSIFCLLLVIGIMIGNKQQQISFPFNEVEVVSETASASIDILQDELSKLQTLAILLLEFGNEYENIMAAAARNNCVGEDLVILFAIRKAENGPPGNEFGIMCQKGTNLSTQTGWAAATIVKNRKRWNDEGQPKDFITYLGNKYCPPEVDPQGYVNWVHNVTYWYEKFKGKEK